MFIESQKIITIVTDSDTSGVLYPIPQKKMDEKKVNVSQNRIFPLGDFLGIKVFNPKDSFDTLQSYDN